MALQQAAKQVDRSFNHNGHIWREVPREVPTPPNAKEVTVTGSMIGTNPGDSFLANAWVQDGIVFYKPL
jgi:hypothetical protein